MPYGRFRVHWLGDDAVTLTNSPDELATAANTDEATKAVSDSG